MQRFNSKCLNALSKRLYARWKRNCLKLRKIAMESRIHQRIKWKQSDRMKGFVGKKNWDVLRQKQRRTHFQSHNFCESNKFPYHWVPHRLSNIRGRNMRTPTQEKWMKKNKANTFFFFDYDSSCSSINATNVAFFFVCAARILVSRRNTCAICVCSGFNYSNWQKCE